MRSRIRTAAVPATAYIFFLVLGLCHHSSDFGSASFPLSGSIFFFGDGDSFSTTACLSVLFFSGTGTVGASFGSKPGKSDLQCLHFTASAFINSAQKGHFLRSSWGCVLHLGHSA